MTRNQILYRQTVEQNRSNLANELLQRQRNEETARSNLANEAEAHRSNLAKEFETNRANVARETETARANRAQETENVRSHKATEALRGAELAETNRSNLAREIENYTHNRATESEAVRHAETVEAETERSNRAQEAETKRGHTLSYMGTVARADATRYSADINAATQRAVEELRQQGLDERQLKQIGADAIYVLHNDLVKAIESNKGQQFIQNVIQEWILRKIRGGK